MTDDPLDAMKARWSYIQGFLFPWMREDNDPITEALGRLVTTLDVIGLEAFVPEPPRGPGRPPEDRRALARATWLSWTEAEVSTQETGIWPQATSMWSLYPVQVSL